eukprot:XP_011425676.2 PREDICTED: uncharacterized protein LOC105327078 [Crassostrea gigas]
MASPSKRMKTDDGPKPITMFVLEDLVVRKYATGEQTFGTSWMLSSDSGFESLKQVIVHEKHIKVLKKMSAYVVIRYTALEDGTLKIGQQTVVMQTKRPDALTEDMIVEFVKPHVVEELGRIGSFENKKRISVKGEVTKVSSVIEGTKSKRKVVTLTDGQASIDVKLWGELAETGIHEGTTIVVTCVHVDLYQSKRSLNSTGGTVIQITDVEEKFSGYVEGVSFEQGSLAIFLNGEVLTCTSRHIDSLFPTHEFIESKYVEGKKKGCIVTAVEEQMPMEKEDLEQVKKDQGEDEQLDDRLLLSDML